MSRSRKKTKIHGITTAESEKKDKQIANRKYRRIVKQKVKCDSEDLPNLREVSDIWLFEKDGKKYNKNIAVKLLRK